MNKSKLYVVWYCAFHYLEDGIELALEKYPNYDVFQVITKVSSNSDAAIILKRKKR